jgi:hypothetical protein
MRQAVYGGTNEMETGTDRYDETQKNMITVTGT